MNKSSESGLYIVTLNNNNPISVNAQDPRIANKAVKVTKVNCKFGKAKSLEKRRKNYFKTFGEKNVNFIPIILLDEIEIAEKMVLKKLDDYRMRGRTGRKNEWLEGISAQEVEKIILDSLYELGVKFTQIGTTHK